MWQETEQPVISAKTLMENLTQIENVGVYLLCVCIKAQVCAYVRAFKYLHMSCALQVVKLITFPKRMQTKVCVRFSEREINATHICFCSN